MTTNVGPDKKKNIEPLKSIKCADLILLGILKKTETLLNFIFRSLSDDGQN